MAKKGQTVLTKSAPESQHVPEFIGRETFPIVGIGASAGGLEALTSFFENLPANTGMAFVVIQHLDPTRAGMLPELLQRLTKMPVTQATDNCHVIPNHVYVIPPNSSISILNATLHLFEPIEPRGLRLPIDIFFHSLAEDQSKNSVGIILSGMGSDGSSGLKDIKEAGGLTLVQEPSSAKFNPMPTNSIKQANPDVIAKAEDLPKKLIAIANKSSFKTPVVELDDKSRNELDKIILLLREQTHQDFSQYKKNTLLRRLERRKAVHLLPETKDYIKFLRENPHEGEILAKEMLIGVTSFFRDPQVWDVLQEKVIPQLIEAAPNYSTIRAWVAACSTGEEAYSLAIVFKECLEKAGTDKRLTFQIFATDLDDDAIHYARVGTYPPTITPEVSEERLSRFFIEHPQGYRVQPVIREMIVFATHNLIKDPPFIKLDLLSCRNLLIYLESAQQQKIINLFGYCLNADGIMVLGTAETPGAATKNFTELNTKQKIFKRTASNLNTSIITFPSTNFHDIHDINMNMKNEAKPRPQKTENLEVLTDQLLLNYFSPASVLINSEGDILYITGSTGKYLEPAKGKANLNIHAMAREGLRELLPGGIRKALKTDQSITLTDIVIENADQKALLSVTIQHIQRPEPLKGTVLIVFRDYEPASAKAKPRVKKGDKTQYQLDLEQEIRQANDLQQITREEMQVSNEESKSINEELQSTNEELQSTNEELTTSKEEMQSLNEELQTVNSELQMKISDFELASADMKNLLSTTELATLFLDKGLNIRRFTDSMTTIFKLRDVDIGRPFTDIVNYLDYPALEDQSRKVLQTLMPFETTILVKNENSLRVRIVPYRTFDDRIDGLVITFTDISELEELRSQLKALQERNENKK